MTPIRKILADQVNRPSSLGRVKTAILIKNERERAIVEEWISDCVRREMPAKGDYVKDSQRGRING
jgi:hypothetical protein